MARVLHEFEVPLDRSGPGGNVEPDIGLVGDDGINQRRVAESQPSPLDLDDEPMLGLLLDDRLERLVQVDPAVGAPLDVQLGPWQLQSHDFGWLEKDLPEVPADDGSVGGDEPGSLFITEDRPIDPRGIRPREVDGGGFQRAGRGSARPGP